MGTGNDIFFLELTFRTREVQEEFISTKEWAPQHLYYKAFYLVVFSFFGALLYPDSEVKADPEPNLLF
jgi:hypothetical protein